MENQVKGLLWIKWPQRLTARKQP